MRRGEIWWVEFDERRPVVLLSEASHPGSGRCRSSLQRIRTLRPGNRGGSRRPGGLPFEGVLRFAFPWPGFTPCTWLTTLSRDDLIERADTVSTAKLSQIDDALRASEQRPKRPGRGGQAQRDQGSLRRRTPGRRRRNGRPR